MITISRKEWGFVVVVVLLAVVLNFLPTVFGYLKTPSDSNFLFRSYINVFDLPVYFSQIEMAKVGRLLFIHLFTSEYQPLGILNPFWLMVGWFAKVFGLSAFLAYEMAQLALIPVCIFVLYSLGAYFFSNTLQRKICLLLMVFASGWGWVAWMISELGHYDVPSILDINVPEAFTFTTFSTPHFIASLILILLVFLFSLKFLEQHNLSYTLLASGSAVTLFSFHPYHVPTIFGVLCGAFGVIAWKERKVASAYAGHLLMVLACSSPVILYYAWVSYSVPVIHEHFLQNITLTPPLWITVLSYGLLLPLALVGSFAVVKQTPSKTQWFLLAWFVIQGCLLYAPLSTQRRLAEGLQIPMSILAVYGLWHMKEFWDSHVPETISVQKILPPGITRWFIGVMVFLMTFGISNMFIVTVSELMAYEKLDPYLYIKKDDQEAMRWLKNTPENSIILSSLKSGNLIPVFSLHQVFIGHPHETTHYHEKEAAVADFWNSTNPQGIEQFLRYNNINYLYFGKEEQQMAKFNPETMQFLIKVYQGQTVSIYQLQ